MDTFGGDYMYLIPNIDEIKKREKLKVCLNANYLLRQD